jgi:hypothetical protein
MTGIDVEQNCTQSRETFVIAIVAGMQLSRVMQEQLPRSETITRHCEKRSDVAIS